MTIKELKEKIKFLPDEMVVFVEQNLREDDFSEADNASVVHIGSCEENGDITHVENVLVISDYL